ncbi:hypothetical protein M233_02870 [Xylella fastidiosa subsp. multiplex Griffin-1]|nr:hypothetical protein M233_02870 [Xylella fastidiosa subsp. multiplex Griffin-1]
MVPAVLAYADCILVQPIFPFQHVDRVMFKWCSSVLHDLGDRVLTAFFHAQHPLVRRVIT